MAGKVGVMAQPVVSRTQRRIERKQLVLVFVLTLAVAVASFVLGVMFAERGGSLTGLAADAQKPKPPMAIQIVPPPAAAGAAEKNDQLTFYENLPKGNQAPLGSGINLPPAQPKPVAVDKPQQAVKPALASAPDSVAPASQPKPAAVPVIAGEGAFVVQIASFRSSEEANLLADRLKSHRLATFVELADLGEKGRWYRVLAGPYANRQGAEQAAGLVQEKERLSALVRQR